MSDENRIWTQNLEQKLTAAHLNDLQDNFAFFWELDGSILAPTVPLAGSTEYYGQFATGAGVANTVIDSSRDWRNRILDITIVEIGNANNLPKVGGYHPDTFVSFAHTVMYTGAGDTPAGPGAGIFWTFRGVTYILAASATVGPVTQGDLFVHATAGEPANKIMVWVKQLPDAS